MGRSVKSQPPDLVIGLNDPGMTPLLRAGLGGLAASLRAILAKAEPRARWPSPVALGKGVAIVEPTRVRIEWRDGKEEDVLRKLFETSFLIDKTYGLIELPGAYDPRRPPPIEVKAALQNGLKRTFLQHGKTTKKAGKTRPISFEIDSTQTSFEIVPYNWFVHQEAWKKILEGLRKGVVDLAGWAYPGAVVRHNAFGATSCEYTGREALCAVYALVGCQSYQLPRGGALVIAEPSDLVQFSRSRCGMTPASLADAYVTGTGDAVLAAELGLRLEAAKGHTGALMTHGVTLQTTAWASQLKSRVSTISPGALPSATLDLYFAITRALPTRIRASMRQDEDDEEQGFFPARSALRGFLTGNIAAGQQWFKGFATATTGGRKARFIHYYKDKDNLGALYQEERKGLVAMLKYLEEAEQALVNSVHVALRQRFGAIADETQGNAATMKNRFKGERDRWRLAFSGAKTCEQIRAALADLWSRAGTNKELQAHWKDLLPLLRSENWQAARDLSLVALASYQGTGEHTDTPDGN